MRRYLKLILLLLSYSALSAQSPQIDVSFKKDMIKKKAELYRLMKLNDQQITANQNDYDVKYYSLNLTPDLSTFILSGEVEVVGEVIAPTLDRVELNFWDGMSISSLHPTGLPGSQLNFSRGYDLLTVNLDRVYTQGEQFRFIIEYQGRPGVPRNPLHN